MTVSDLWPKQPGVRAGLSLPAAPRDRSVCVCCRDTVAFGDTELLDPSRRDELDDSCEFLRQLELTGDLPHLDN